MSQNIYCLNQEDFDEKLNKHINIGYVFKRENDNPKYLFLPISDEVVQLKGKCNACDSLIEYRGIHSHGRQCEVCGETIYLQYKKGDKIRFSFIESQEIQDITLEFYEYNQNEHKIYFYETLPEQRQIYRNNSLEIVQKELEAHKNDYEIIEKEGIKLFAFNYDLHSFRLIDNCKINIMDSYPSGYNNTEIVRIFEGKEYDKFLDDLPIPDSVTLYRDWLIEKNGKEILNRCGVSPSPEYYSGRGATLSDLNDTILENIYQMVKDEHDLNAANEFAKMVSDIPVLSATDFIKCFFKLERNEFKWDSKFIPTKNKGIEVTNEITAIATVLSGFGGYQRNDSHAISSKFLERHNIKSKDNRFRNGYWVR